MTYRLHDLIDLEHFQNLQDRLNEIYSFPSAIIDNEGNILTATAWQDVCTQFHRKHPDCERECRLSDQYILSHLHEANPAVSYRCPRGLVDNATPIVIDGIHYGNFFTGQFFLEKPDMDFFRAQAKKFGFEEDAYLKAVAKVPIWTQEQLNSYLFFIKGLIAVISESGLKRLKETEARKQIEASEERASTILRTAMDGFWLVDTQARLLEVNDAYCQMSGYTREELLRMSIADLEADKSTDEIAAHIDQLKQAGCARFERRHRRKDGRMIDVELSVNFLPTSGGRIFCFLRDITERKRAVEALETESARTRILFDQSPEGILIVDPRTARFLDFNTAAHRQLGYSREEFAQLNIFDVEALETVEETKTRIAGVIQAGKADFETLQRTRQGEIRNVHVTAHLIQFQQQSVYHCIWRDITERKRGEVALRESEARLNEAQSIAHLGNWERDHLKNTLLWSDETFRIFEIAKGSSFASYIAFTEAVHPEDRDAVKTAYAQSLETRKPYRITHRLLMPDGRIKFVQEQCETRYSADGKPLRSVGIVQDITERKRAEAEKAKLEAQFQQAQKMESVGQLAGGVAHDFNNILAAIMMRLGYMQWNTSLDEETQESLKELAVDVQRAASLTRQLLMFSRRSILEIKVLDLNEVVANLLKMLGRLIGEHISLRFDQSEALPAVEADAGMIEQVVMNLCVNARDAMPEGGRLTLSIAPVKVEAERFEGNIQVRPGAFVCLSVADTGCGMDEATLKRVFEPFFTTKEIGKGTGLGLATVHGIVAQHKGWVEVESEFGKGTTFKVFLPATMKERMEPAQTGKMEVTRGRETILLVEDESILRRMLAQGLRSLGYRVFEADNGQNAMTLWQEHGQRIDLLFTDMVMPEGMTGLDLAEKLKGEKSGLKVIISSGYSADMAGQGRPTAGGIVYLQKPYPFELLSKTVRDCLDRA